MSKTGLFCGIKHYAYYLDIISILTGWSATTFPRKTTYHNSGIAW